jgi:aspartyl protease family protein
MVVTSRGDNMLRKLLILGIFAGSSASVPILYQSNPDAVDRMLKSVIGGEAEFDVSSAEINVVRPGAPVAERMLGRKVQIKVGPQGHFNANFRLNGRYISAVVDTGATLVAINLSTARRIGIPITGQDFKYSVNTANGKARAASAVIDRLEIGRVTINNVQAVVLDDKALSGTLIGASFLNRLAKYQVEDGALLLVQ